MLWLFSVSDPPPPPPLVEEWGKVVGSGFRYTLQEIHLRRYIYGFSRSNKSLIYTVKEFLSSVIVGFTFHWTWLYLCIFSMMNCWFSSVWIIYWLVFLLYQQIKACVLHVDPTLKIVTLTQLGHLVTPDLAPKRPFGEFAVGDTVEEATVWQIDKLLGVFFWLGSGIRAQAQVGAA